MVNAITDVQAGELPVRHVISLRNAVKKYRKTPDDLWNWYRSLDLGCECIVVILLAKVGEGAWPVLSCTTILARCKWLKV